MKSKRRRANSSRTRRIMFAMLFAMLVGVAVTAAGLVLAAAAEPARMWEVRAWLLGLALASGAFYGLWVVADVVADLLDRDLP